MSISWFRKAGLATLALLLIVGQTWTQESGIWRERSIPLADTQYTMIDFADSMNGWVFTRSGDFIKTSDNGSTWAKKNLEVFYPVQMVKLYDSMDGTVVSGWREKALLHSTSDGGTTWNNIILPDSLFFSSAGLSSISILSKTAIGFVDRSKSLFVSTDRGSHWDSIYVGLPRFEYFGHLHIVSIDRIIVGGGAGWPGTGFLYKSTDAGLTWSSLIDTNDIGGLYEITWTRSEFVSNYLAIFRMSIGYDPPLLGTRFYNFTQGVAFTSYVNWIYGANYGDGNDLMIPLGSELQLMNPPEDSLYQFVGYQAGGEPLKKLATVSPGCAWILANDGRLLQRVDRLTGVGDTGIKDVGGERAESYVTISTFPNPFNGGTNIRIRFVEHKQNVQVSIADLQGRRISVLYQGDMEVGERQFIWPAQSADRPGASSGVYFVVVSSDGNITTRRMLHMK